MTQTYHLAEAATAETTINGRSIERSFDAGDVVPATASEVVLLEQLVEAGLAELVEGGAVDEAPADDLTVAADWPAPLVDDVDDSPVGAVKKASRKQLLQAQAAEIGLNLPTNASIAQLEAAIEAHATHHTDDQASAGPGTTDESTPGDAGGQE